MYALGSIIGGAVVNAGATLQSAARGPTFAAETLTLNGTGFVGSNLAGAFRPRRLRSFKATLS